MVLTIHDFYYVSILILAAMVRIENMKKGPGYCIISGGKYNLKLMFSSLNFTYPGVQGSIENQSDRYSMGMVL